MNDLNRDVEGGALKKIARLLDERLTAGATRLVLDNTYVTRASRYEVVRVASAHGARVRCIHLETPLADAQINVDRRACSNGSAGCSSPKQLDKQAQPTPLRSRRRPSFACSASSSRPLPTKAFRVSSASRSFGSTPKAASPALSLHWPRSAQPAAISGALIALLSETPDASPALVYAWQPDATRRGCKHFALRWKTPRPPPVAASKSPFVRILADARFAGAGLHCRRLLLAFAHRHRIDLRISTLVGASKTDGAMARALGMSFRYASAPSF